MIIRPLPLTRASEAPPTVVNQQLTAQQDKSTSQFQSWPFVLSLCFGKRPAKMLSECEETTNIRTLYNFIFIQS